MSKKQAFVTYHEEGSSELADCSHEDGLLDGERAGTHRTAKGIAHIIGTWTERKDNASNIESMSPVPAAALKGNARKRNSLPERMKLTNTPGHKQCQEDTAHHDCRMKGSPH